MARLFTTTFSFEQQSYTAVVSITTCLGTHTVMIYLPDESLHHLLPGGRISFDTTDGLLLKSPDLAGAEELLTNVLQAIEAYREKQPLPIRVSQLLTLERMFSSDL